MNEQNLDSLIAATLDRQHLLEELNKATIADIRRQVRRRRMRRWARVVAFSFGLPFMVLACAYLFYMYVLPTMQSSAYALVLLFPLLAIIYAVQRAIRNFSPDLV